jgi:glycosyltransferase involved in cell wall biosynthesis
MDYEAMGRFAYEYSQSIFNWETIAGEMKKLYVSVLYGANVENCKA